MLSLDLDEFMFEFKEGAIKHVGPSNRSATAKLYDVEDAGARAFGDRRVKLSFTDEDGNEVEIALSPEQARAIGDDIGALVDESPVFE